ncbi:chitin synthase [Colletotrichum scovillei]|uniref:Chitin synthase n=1 Tax=Colletotrichum scovillei TaxID=1209932 RepID=A0A9P7RG63_9PEZI|nr:chitin synthase [Colletotrichum scovillei]KAG7074900.1 chitin synthase [Colletotrichum scovillei]KAG7082034.1 chitin synthase [Colletotrichum scovillei]
MVVAAKAKWLKNTTELQTCLGVNFKSCFNCQGHSATKSSCGNAVSKASRSEMPFVMLDIINCGNLASASVHLEQLASLALCKRSHQSQAGEMATQWKARIRPYLEVGNDDGVAEENDAKTSPVRPQRTAMITPPSAPIVNKRDVRQPVSTRSSQRTAAPPPPVTPRRATRAPRGSASSTAVLIEEDLGDDSEEDDSDGENSGEDSEEEEKYFEPEPVRSQTSRARAPAPSVKWEPNGKAGLPYPYPSQKEGRENLEYKLAKAQAELAMYEAWARLQKFE